MSARGRRPGRAIILMYHRVSASSFDTQEGDYVISPAAFADQMALLAAQPGRVVGLEALLSGECGP